MADGKAYGGSVPAQPTFYHHIGAFTIPIIAAGNDTSNTHTVTKDTDSVKIGGATDSNGKVKTPIYVHGGI